MEAYLPPVPVSDHKVVHIPHDTVGEVDRADDDVEVDRHVDPDTYSIFLEEVEDD